MLSTKDAFLFSGTQMVIPFASPVASVEFLPSSVSSSVSPGLSSKSSRSPGLIRQPRTFREFECDQVTPSTVDLIRAALLESPGQKATLVQICGLITTCYKDARRFKQLRGNVRQRLSHKPWFQLAERPEWQRGKGQYWLYVEALDTGLKPIPHRQPRQAQRQPPRSSVHTQSFTLDTQPVVDLTQPHKTGEHSPASTLRPSNPLESSIIATRPTPEDRSVPSPFADPGIWLTPTMTSTASYTGQSGLSDGPVWIQSQMGHLGSCALHPMWGIGIPVETPELQRMVHQTAEDPSTETSACCTKQSMQLDFW
ncbi:hypothetical protein FRB98_003724 [Tulasnella sp. 332]|nr:hypothetical protein FRB98_003724 [Tulasnella sp. 332]